MAELFNLVTVEQAWDILERHLSVSEPRREKIDILNSLGRVLAEDVVSSVNVPDFNRSTVDGYAVRARDTFGATEAMPAMLDIVGEVLMGTHAAEKTGLGQAVAIPTGGMLPEGTDAVVMVEYTEKLDDKTVLVFRPVSPGENTVLRGEDVSTGQVLLKKGSVIRPQDIGAMAGIGMIDCNVVPKVRVGILSTGDEIVSPDIEPGPGQIRDINSYAVSGMVKEAGGEAVKYGIVRDDFNCLKEIMIKALKETDVVVVSGGSSVGARDVTYSVINTLGKPGVLVHGVSVKPGKPTILGVVDNKPIIGLPGHPVSTMVLSELFLIPLIRGYMGLGFTPPKRQVKRAVLSRSLASQSGRVDFIRVALREGQDGIKAEPVLGKSGLITTMVKADGVLIIPMEKEGIEAGESVDIVMF